MNNIPSDETLQKIIYLLDRGYYLFSEYDGFSYPELINYLKEKWSNEKDSY